MDVIVTVRLNGSIPGSRKEPVGGLVCTVRLASDGAGLPEPFLHSENKNEPRRIHIVTDSLFIRGSLMDSKFYSRYLI